MEKPITTLTKKKKLMENLKLLVKLIKTLFY